MNSHPWTRKGGFLAGLVLSTMMVLQAGPCSATPITYTVGQAIGLGGVTGTVQTNGTTGVLSASDIVGWNLELTGVGAAFNLTSPASSVFLVGGDLTATATDLYFNFSASDGGYVLFQLVPFSGTQYYCDQALGGGPCLQGASVVPQYYTDPSAQIVPEGGNQVIATAAADPVPEPMTLVLFGAGLLGLGGADLLACRAKGRGGSFVFTIRTGRRRRLS
jgi:hypothetical protein